MGPDAAKREARGLALARTGAIAALVGAYTSPPLANFGLAMLLAGFLMLPTAIERLRTVLRCCCWP
jgi:hypothetical protein